MVGGGHGSPGNSDGGNSGGRGGSGGSSGGGGATGGGGRGNNTPGHPGNPGRRGNSAPDGRGNNTPGHPDNPGRVGNSAPDGRGSNTPGSPDNPGRRGTHAAGSTAASRARSAMDRHARERNTGIGPEFSLTASLQEKADEGTMSPREADMAIGMATARNAEGLTQSMSSAAGEVTGAISNALGITGLPGVSSLGEIGLSAAADTGIPSNPESQYGAAHTRSRMSNNAAQDAGQMAAGLLGGAPAGFAAGAINAGINMGATTDIGRLGETMGVSAGESNSSNTAGAGGKRGTPSTARAAMSPKAQPAQSFEWNPVDMKQYSRGLLSLAQSS